MKTSLKALLLATLCTSALSSVHAADEKKGLYLGVSGGHVVADDWGRIQGNVAAIVGGPSTSATNSDTGFGGAVGYRLNRNLAVEAAYIDAGEAITNHDTVPASYSEATQHAGVSLLFIGAITQNIELYGRLGVVRWESEATFTTAGIPTKSTISGNDLIYGAGLSYALSSRLDLTGDYQRLKMKVPGGNLPIDHYMLGLRYGFY